TPRPAPLLRPCESGPGPLRRRSLRGGRSVWPEDDGREPAVHGEPPHARRQPGGREHARRRAGHCQRAARTGAPVPPWPLRGALRAPRSRAARPPGSAPHARRAPRVASTRSSARPTFTRPRAWHWRSPRSDVSRRIFLIVSGVSFGLLILRSAAAPETYAAD